MLQAQFLKGLIEDLEAFANELPSGLAKVDIEDNLTKDQRSGFNFF